MVIMHRPQPGPMYWDWRCIACDQPVDLHASLFARIIERLRRGRAS